MSEDKAKKPTEWWQLGIPGPQGARKKKLKEEETESREYGREKKVRIGKQRQWSWF